MSDENTDIIEAAEAWLKDPDMGEEWVIVSLLVTALKEAREDHSDPEKTLIDSVNKTADERDALAAVIAEAISTYEDDTLDTASAASRMAHILSAVKPEITLAQRDAKNFDKLAQDLRTMDMTGAKNDARTAAEWLSEEAAKLRKDRTDE